MKSYFIRARMLLGAVCIGAFILPGILQAAEIQATNLIQNPSLEERGANGLPISWSKGRYGVHTATFTYPVTGRNGNAAKVEISNYSSGDAKWYFKDVPATPGKNYTFSDYYRSNVSHFVTVRYALADGSFRYIDIGRPAASNDWKKFETVFQAPQGAVSLTIFHLIKSTGFLVTDDYRLAEVGAPVFSEGFVSLNFDDGWKSAYTYALPILDRAKTKGTFYITTGRLGYQDFMTANNVQKIYQSGHEVGAHTRTHPHLPLLSKSQMVTEIVGSKNDLGDLGIQAKTFSYPFGEYNETALGIAKSNFGGARATGGLTNSANQDKYLLRSVSLKGDTPVATVKKWIDDAARDKVWLILVFHRINEADSGNYTTTAGDLREIVDYLVKKQMTVKTVAEGIAILEKFSN